MNKNDFNLNRNLLNLDRKYDNYIVLLTKLFY